jgi:hypothetical protein
MPAKTVMRCDRNSNVLPKPKRQGSVRFEFLLALMLLVLLLQLSQTLRSWLLSVIDLRHWSRTSWFIANLVMVVVLVAIRFGPEALFLLRQSANRLRRNRTVSAQSNTDSNGDYEQRKKRDAEWRRRAKKRLPFT